MTARSLAAAPGARVPAWPLIGAKIVELRKRQTLMIVAAAALTGLPVAFYLIRELYHLGNPALHQPAGTPAAFATAANLMDEFGFIIAATLGVTAGSSDLTDGMFRQLVITGRSRIALYLARIPAGLAILVPLAAAGFTIACLATAFLATPHPAATLTPTAGAMAGSGLWIELDLLIGFTVGLGLGSLMGQRTVPVILLIVLDIIITPPLTTRVVPGLLNGQRAIVGVAMAQLKPAALAGGTRIGPGASATPTLPPMPAWAMITVITGWILIWTALGAWKMATRDT